jgi:hypothetical protein
MPRSAAGTQGRAKREPRQGCRTFFLFPPSAPGTARQDKPGWRGAYAGRVRAPGMAWQDASAWRATCPLRHKPARYVKRRTRLPRARRDARKRGATDIMAVYAMRCGARDRRASQGRRAVRVGRKRTRARDGEPGRQTSPPNAHNSGYVKRGSRRKKKPDRGGGGAVGLGLRMEQLRESR